MDPSTPPTVRSNPSSQSKSASRLSRITYAVEDQELPRQSLDLVLSSSPKKTPSAPSALSLKSSYNSLPLQELLLLSPSPSRRSRTRLTDRIDMAEDAGEPAGSRRRHRSRGSQLGALGCASPRNNRRSRKRSEGEIREERDLVGLAEDNAKTRRRRHSGRTKKEKLSLVPSLPSSTSTPKANDGNGGNLDRIGMMLSDMIMWKDVARSSLWFGIGCLCFLSSCFAKGINFSIFSAISQLGLLFLGASFFTTSICQRNNLENRSDFKLKEEDIVRVGRLILPAANLAISMTRELFSGKPSMTLKVIPFLLLGAEYGHLLTLWRLCVIGFFSSFTVPKLYACYSNQINQRVENTKCWLLEAWGTCSHKKIVAASAVTAFWNLSGLKTRILTAFISLVILRCCRKNLVLPKQEQREVEEAGEEELQQQQALVVMAAEATSQQIIATKKD